MCVSFYQNLTPYDIKIATTPVCCYNCHVGVTEAIQTYMSEVRVSHLGPLTVYPNRRIYGLFHPARLNNHQTLELHFNKKGHGRQKTVKYIISKFAWKDSKPMNVCHYVRTTDDPTEIPTE